MGEHLLAFLGVSLLLAITPGPDFALVTRNSLAYGRRGVLLTTTGLAGALILWVAASAAGVVALLEASRSLFSVLKIAGGVYLAYLGLRTLWSTRREAPPLVEAPPPKLPPGGLAVWRQGFLSALLNPKLGVFFVTFLPQFVDTTRPVGLQIVILGSIFIAIGITWMTLYGLSVSKLRDVLMSPRVRRGLERVTGTVLVGFGAVLVFNKQ